MGSACLSRVSAAVAAAGGSGGGGGGGGGRHRGGGGDSGPGSDGSTAPPSGNLAAQRAGFMKELEADPKLKAYAIDAMQHEGGIQSNMEQLFNYAAMRKMTIRQALHSGQYGPVNRGLISGNISAKTRQAGEAALGKVGAGSNITDYATDQGMAGDPNFARYMANREHFGMHKVEGAWFSAHGEPGVKWAQRQRAADAASTAKAAEDVKTSSNVALPPMSERYSSQRLADENSAAAKTRGAEGGDRLYVSPSKFYDTMTGERIPSRFEDMPPGGRNSTGMFNDWRRSSDVDDRREAQSRIPRPSRAKFGDRLGMAQPNWNKEWLTNDPSIRAKPVGRPTLARPVSLRHPERALRRT